MSKIPKVYVLGDARGYYRVQNVIKYFVDRPNEYRCSFNNYWSKSHIIKYFKSIFINTFHVICSDIVYVSILNVDIDILYEMFIAWILRKKIVVDFYVGIREKVVLDEAWFKEGGFFDKLAILLEKYYFNVATKVLFLSEFEKKRYCDAMHKDSNSDKCVVIPHCVEESFKMEYKSTKEFNICWWGSYLPLHGLDTILDAVKIVKENGYDVKWYFFGNSNEKAIPYIEKAKKLGVLDDCIFENTFTMKNGKLRNFLISNCTVALGNFGTSIKARSLMSNKVLDACAMKCPVISGNSTAYFQFFDGNTDIYLCECDPNALAKKVEYVYKLSEEEMKNNVERAYDVFEENFSVDKFCLLFSELLDSIK